VISFLRVSGVPQKGESPTPLTRKKEITMTKSRHMNADTDADADTVADTATVAATVAATVTATVPAAVTAADTVTVAAAETPQPRP